MSNKQYELKRKYRKTLSKLWKKLRKIDNTLVETLKDFFDGSVTSVTEEHIAEFREKLIGEDAEKFDGYDADKQKAIVGKAKDNAEFMKKAIDIVDVLLAEYEELDEEIDELIMGATGKTIDELDELTISEFAKLVMEVVKDNINFSFRP